MSRSQFLALLLAGLSVAACNKSDNLQEQARVAVAARQRACTRLLLVARTYRDSLAILKRGKGFWAPDGENCAYVLEQDTTP